MFTLRSMGGLSLLLFCGLVVSAASADELKPEDNAALVHWQAFAQLPSVSEDSEKLVANASTTKLDDDTRELVAKANGALVSLRRAASMPYCEWGLEFSAGPHMMMPHLSKARQMARYSCLYARHQFDDGQAEEALETVRDTLILARHAGSDDVIISALVQIAIERMVIETVARELTRLSTKHVDTLVGYLDTLPSGTSVAKSLKLERVVFLGWARRIVQEATTDQEAVQQLRSIVDSVDTLRDEEGFTRAQLVTWLEGTDKDYDEIQAIFDLPDDEFRSRWNSMLERVRKENPLSSMVLPGMDKLREARDHRTATWALFRTALAIHRDGKQQLASTEDPFGNGPFQYTTLPAGFRLRSQFNYRGRPTELTIGPLVSE